MSKLICLDFDGVLHSYTSPWVNESHIPDPPVPGAIEFIESLFSNNFKVCIFSTRNANPDAVVAMRQWLVANGLPHSFLPKITFPIAKPVYGSVFIDDRAFCFQGVFPSIQYLQSFTPWNKV